MPSPVKVSDKLLALAREEGREAHRSATAQIEHWATLGRAVEVMVAHRDVLALKRAGQALPVPPVVRPEEVHDLLARLVEDEDREAVKARIGAGGTPVYTADPDHPGLIIQVAADGTRTPGRFVNRRFVAAGQPADERGQVVPLSGRVGGPRRPVRRVFAARRRKPGARRK